MSGLIRSPAADLPRRRWFGKVASKLSKALTGKVRVAYAGTSIATFQSSPGSAWVAQVQRIFGDSGDRVNYLTFLGGSQTSAYSGWEKQTFGGPQFSRLRGKSTSAAFDIFTSSCRYIAIRYSKEADGGAWSVSLNGGAPQAIDSSGAQSYRNELVLDAGADGIHKLTITPPAAGFAYFEAYECRTSDNGVFVDNSTFGGTSAQNMLVGYSVNNGAGVATIPPVGFNGVDSHFNAATKPDVFIWQFTVNDVGDGSAHFATDYRSILDRVVTLCRQNDIPLILLIEPFGHFGFTLTNDAQGTRDNAAAIRDYQLRAAAANEHVYVIDWHALTYISDIVRYTSIFYPAVVLSNGNATYNGDFIHPAQPIGYAPCTMALCASTGVPYPQSSTFGGLITDQRQDIYAGSSALAVSTPTTRSNGRGSKRRIADQFGAQHVVTEVGKAITLQSDGRANVCPVFHSDTMVSGLVGGYQGAPGLSDRWGAYFGDMNNSGGNLQLPAGYAGYFTLTALMSPILGGGTYSTSISLTDAGFDAYLPNGQKAAAGGAPSILKNDWDVAAVGGQPVYVSLTCKRGASASDVPGFRATGRVYAVWLTFTSFPVITDRTRAGGVPADLSMPVYRIGDPLYSDVLAGQEVVEVINGKDLKKISLATSVVKINVPGSRYRAYRAKLESSIEVLKGQPEFTGTLVANGVLNAEYGGLVYSIGNARRHLFPALASAYGANYQGKTFTLMMRLAQINAAGLKVGLLGAGNYAMFASLDGGGNVVWTEYASGNAPATVGDTLTPLDVTWAYRNLAFTFTFPALTANMGGGAAGTITPFFYVAGGGTDTGYSYLVDGSSFLL